MARNTESAYKLLLFTAALEEKIDNALHVRAGIGFSQYKILKALQNEQKLSQSHIARELSQTEASISRQAGILEENSFIKKHINPENKRERLVSLTAVGKQLLKTSDRVMEDFDRIIAKELSHSQIDNLIVIRNQLIIYSD